MSVRNDITIDWEASPRIIKIAAPSAEVTMQDLVDTLKFLEASPNPGWDVFSYPYIIDASGKQPLGGGVLVGITNNLKNAYILFEGRTTPLEEGTCTTSDSTGTTLYASGGQFVTNGVVVGDTVMNYTTRALATVIDVVSNIELKMIQLSGGSRSTWVASDEYIVWNNEQCNISGGNLVAVDSGDSEMSPVLPSPNVQVVRTASSSATLQESAAIEYSSFNGGVHLDVVNGVSGIAYPTGTERQRSDNLTDALLIAEGRGFDKIFVYGNFTLKSGDDITDMIIVGQNAHLSTLTFEAGCVTDGAEFMYATLQGVTSGEICTDHCMIGDLTAKGCIEYSFLLGTLTLLDGNSVTILADCRSAVPGMTTPIVDFVGAGRSLSVRAYSGGLDIRNMADASNKLTVEFVAGQCILNSSCSAGTASIRGPANIIDNSTGTTVDVASLINKSILADEVWDEARSGHTTPGTYGATDEWAGEVDEAAIADAVWDEAVAGHTGAGTFGGDSQAERQRLLGLSGEHKYIDQTSHDSNKMLISARVRIFDSKANCDLATDGGNETQGLLRSYTMTTVWEEKNMVKTIKQVGL
jgi:hypothetical protein